MTELINRIDIKKINKILQKIHKIVQKVDIFCSALLLQAWRRIYFTFNRQAVYTSIQRRKGNCLRCGRCCHASIRCSHLDYDENGLSLCKVHDRKPRMCKLYPYNENDFFFHLKSTCGYWYADE